MSDSFDPYHVWLGIPPEEQPADHYRLLGLTRLEENRDVISHAAEQRMSHLRSMQAGPRSDQTQLILNQLSAARSCLMTPEQKAAYDAKLREQTKTDSVLAFAPPIPVSKPAAPAEHPRTGASSPITILLAVGVAAGLSLIAAVALGLAWMSGTQSDGNEPVTEHQAIEEPSPRPQPLVKQPTQIVPKSPRPSLSPQPATPITVPSSEPKGSVEPPAEIIPKRNFAVRLRGVDAILLDNTANLFSMSDDFTVELWARFHPTPEARSIIGNQVSLEDGSSAGWLLRIPNPVPRTTDRFITLRGAFRFGAHWPKYESGWRHIAVCCNHAGPRVFIDGALVLIANDDAELWPASDSDIMIGRNPQNKNYKMFGQNKVPHNIGDFRGDIRALRISSECLYEEDFRPSSMFEEQKDDVVLLDFSIGDGDVVPDLSGNGHDGKIVSGEWIPLPESMPDPVPAPDVVASGTTRDWNEKSYRGYDGQDADEFANAYQSKGYRRAQDQRLIVIHPVVSPTVFTAQRLELHSDIRADVAIVAQRVDIHGHVRGNLDIWAQVVYVEPGAVIEGNLRVHSAQVITVKGRVEGIISGHYGRVLAE
jgi:hypothetical protein